MYKKVLVGIDHKLGSNEDFIAIYEHKPDGAIHEWYTGNNIKDFMEVIIKLQEQHYEIKFVDM